MKTEKNEEMKEFGRTQEQERETWQHRLVQLYVFLKPLDIEVVKKLLYYKRIKKKTL